MIGNSSSGIRETPYYGIPCINIGERQQNRANSKNILNIKKLKKAEQIFSIYNRIKNKKFNKQKVFGSGKSGEKINKILLQNKTWNYDLQKYFNE